MKTVTLRSDSWDSWWWGANYILGVCGGAFTKVFPHIPVRKDESSTEAAIELRISRRRDTGFRTLHIVPSTERGSGCNILYRGQEFYLTHSTTGWLAANGFNVDTPNTIYVKATAV